MADTEVSSTPLRYDGNRGSGSHAATTASLVPGWSTFVVVVCLEVVGDDHGPQPRPGQEDRAHQDQHDAGPQVGVDAAGLVLLGVAEDADQQDDQPVDAEQGTDDVPDVEDARAVAAVAGLG